MDLALSDLSRLSLPLPLPPDPVCPWNLNDDPPVLHLLPPELAGDIFLDPALFLPAPEMLWTLLIASSLLCCRSCSVGPRLPFLRSTLLDLLESGACSSSMSRPTYLFVGLELP